MSKRWLFLLLLFLPCFSAFSQSCKLSAVYFKSGKYSLTKKHRQQLDTILASFEQTEFYLVELHGMTDTTDNRDFNKALAQKRINSVKEYITARHLNIDFIEWNTGESVMTEGGDAANRRVDIWYMQLTTTRSVILKGELGESIAIPVKQFNDCGYCTNDLKLRSEWTTSELAPGQTERFLRTTVESNCDTLSGRQECISAELRIPLLLYNTSSELKVPNPLQFRDCCNTRDSLSLRWLHGITVGIDTVAQEYVVTVPCYNFDRGCICCATINAPCPEYKFTFPEGFRPITTYTIQGNDTIRVHQDSLYTICNENLESYGYRGNKFVWLSTPWRKLDKTSVYLFVNDTNKQVDHYRIDVREKDYSPLKYSTIRVRIKSKRNVAIDSMGYYVSHFNLCIPIAKSGKRTFEKQRLESKPFQFIFFQEGHTYIIPSSMLKTRYNKRKKIIKVKVKKQHLRNAVLTSGMITLPDE